MLASTRILILAIVCFVAASSLVSGDQPDALTLKLKRQRIKYYQVEAKSLIDFVELSSNL